MTYATTINIKIFGYGGKFFRLDLDTKIDTTFLRDRKGELILKFSPDGYAVMPDKCGTYIGKCRLDFKLGANHHSWEFHNFPGWPEVEGSFKDIYDLEVAVGKALMEHQASKEEAEA